MNLTGLIVVLVLVVGFFLLVWIGSRKKIAYKVTTADNQVLHLFKTGSDRFWQTDKPTVMLFHTKEGKAIRVSTHWILTIEEE